MFEFKAYQRQFSSKMELELDEFNDETFGDEDIGDWELEHDKFVSELSSSNLPPSACDIPKFWEAKNLSEFWSPGDLEVSQAFDVGLNLEETIERLVCDEEFEDPAILDISKRMPQTQHSKLFSDVTSKSPKTESEIWSTEKSESTFINSLIRSGSASVTDNNESRHHGTNKAANQLQQIMKMFKATQHQSIVPPMKPENDNSISTHNIKNENRYKPLVRPPNWAPPVLPLIAPQRFILPFSNRPPLSFNNLPQAYKYIDSNQLRGFAPNLGQVIPNISQFQLLPSAFGIMQQSARNSLIPLIGRSFPTPTSSMEGSMLARPPNLFLFPGMFQTPALSQPLQAQIRKPQLHTNNMLPPAFLGAHTSAELIRIEETLIKRKAEMDDDDDDDATEFDFCGSWMTPREHMLVLNCQLRSLTVANPYVEDYYFAVKWLRLMTKERDRKISAGVLPNSLPPPYFHLSTPVSTLKLISAEHHHWIARRCRFVRVVVGSGLGGTRGKNPRDTTISTQAPPNPAPQTKLRDHRLSSSSSVDASHYASQLGRPTKSNVNAQRIIADLSVVTALEEEEEDEVEKDVPFTKKVTSKRFLRNSDVLKQRRRLVTLARIERLYATVLNIDETNVSIARIFVKNDESRHLMSHRTNLLNALLSDLFTKTVTPQPLVSAGGDTTTPPPVRRLNLDIFEVPKGVRLFPPVLRFLAPEDGQLCAFQFILNFDSILACSNGGLDAHANLLYVPLRYHVYNGCERKEFIRNCLPLLFDSGSTTTTTTSDKASAPTLDANALAMFTSRLGVSIFFCLLDACARNSRREDPGLFCDLFFYACRVLSHLSSTRPDMDFPAPLEKFPHFSALDPAFLMSEDLKNMYSAPVTAASPNLVQNRRTLQDFGLLLRLISICVEPCISTDAVLIRATSLNPSTPQEQQQQSSAAAFHLQILKGFLRDNVHTNA